MQRHKPHNNALLNKDYLILGPSFAFYPELQGEQHQRCPWQYKAQRLQKDMMETREEGRQITFLDDFENFNKCLKKNKNKYLKQYW